MITTNQIFDIKTTSPPSSSHRQVNEVVPFASVAKQRQFSDTLAKEVNAKTNTYKQHTESSQSYSSQFNHAGLNQQGKEVDSASVKEPLAGREKNNKKESTLQPSQRADEQLENPVNEKLPETKPELTLSAYVPAPPILKEQASADEATLQETESSLEQVNTQAWKSLLSSVDTPAANLSPNKNSLATVQASEPMAIENQPLLTVNGEDPPLLQEQALVNQNSLSPPLQTILQEPDRLAEAQKSEETRPKTSDLFSLQQSDLVELKKNAERMLSLNKDSLATAQEGVIAAKIMQGFGEAVSEAMLSTTANTTEQAANTITLAANTTDQATKQIFSYPVSPLANLVEAEPQLTQALQVDVQQLETSSLNEDVPEQKQSKSQESPKTLQQVFEDILSARTNEKSPVIAQNETKAEKTGVAQNVMQHQSPLPPTSGEADEVVIQAKPNAAELPTVQLATTQNIETQFRTTEARSTANVFQQTLNNLETMLNSGQKFIRIQLHPENLGGVELRITSQGGALQIAIIADTAVAQQALERHAQELQQVLQQAGVNLSGLTVGQRNSSEQQRTFREKHSSKNPLWQETELETPTPTVLSVNAHGVDFRV